MALSAVHACIQRYEQLPPSAFPDGQRPPIYFAEVPQSSGNQRIRPPYVVVSDEGTQTEYQADSSAIETTRLRLEIFAPELGQCDAIARAIKYGGQVPGQRAGLDWSNWPASPPYAHVHARRLSEQRDYAGWDWQAQRIHRIVLNYEVIRHLRAEG